MAGIFITFEGIEGSGKSTQLARLAEHLRGRGYDPLVTREPGGTTLGRAMRDALLAPGVGARARSPLTEALLMVADRHEHVVQVIAPALEAGRIVLADRHSDSTLAYQGGGSGVDLADLRFLNGLAVGAVRPALTLLFDLPVQVALERMAARAREAGSPADRFEAETRDFHERVRQAYLDLARHEPGRVARLDAERDPESVFDDMQRRVEALLSASGESGFDSRT
ncbi:MAG: dTMP kinase [Candidatus Eisenbacteria bacterium]